MQRMWNIKTEVIPAKTGAIETASKSVHKICEQHTGKAQHQRTTENSCTHISESIKVTVTT
jgi:hypothetical protein